MIAIIEALLATLQAQFTTQFTRYYYGKPFVPAQSEMPSLYIRGLGTQIINTGTVRDETIYSLEAGVIVDVKELLNNNDPSASVIAYHRKLHEFVEARDVNGDLSTASVAGCLRNNFTATNNALYLGDFDIQYSEELGLDNFPYVVGTIQFAARNRTRRNTL